MVEKPILVVRMRRLATGCVLAAFIVRLVAAYLPESLWVDYLRAFTEAAVVGGLADWFAVTALFRHPLGLPIPHTRILPNSKDRIGASLSQFVVANFLNREVVARELDRLDLSAEGAEFLQKQADVIAGGAVKYLPRLLAALDDEDIGRFLESQLSDRIRTIPVAPLAGRLLDLLTSGGKEERLVDDLLKLSGDALRDNQDVLAGLIRKEIPIPDALSMAKDKLAGFIAEEAVKRILRTLETVQNDPRHEIRVRIRERIARLAFDLRESPEMKARGEEMKKEVLSNPNVTVYAARIWAETKAALLTDAAHPEGELRRRLAAALRRAAAQVAGDASIRGRFNSALRSAALDIVSANAARFGKIIEDTVARWDGAELGRKLELEVGYDLQFVRLNGTLVGGLFGMALHLLTTLLG